MNKYRKLISFVLAFAMVICGSATVNAASLQSDYSEIPTIGYAASETKTVNPGVSPKQAVGISRYASTISSVGTTVYFAGDTLATHLASKIGSTLVCLEVWNGYNWSIVHGRSYFNYNDYSCSVVYSCQVQGGKYYRTTGVHTAIINGTTFSYSSESGYIYIQ